MKITLIIKGEKKEMEIKENENEDEKYLNFLKDVKTLKKDLKEFNLIFTDDEEEKIIVKDKFDFEYMISLADSGDLEILVEDFENEKKEKEKIKKKCDFKKKKNGKDNLNFKENEKIEKTLILDDNITLDSNFVEGLDKKVLLGFIEKKKRKIKKKQITKKKKITKNKYIQK